MPPAAAACSGRWSGCYPSDRRLTMLIKMEQDAGRKAQPGTPNTCAAEETKSAAANAVIRQIQSTLQPKIVKLVQQQRLRFLTEGTRFAKYSSRGQRAKDKFWFCRLSPNHQTLFFGDCDENQIPVTKELKNKFPVSEMKDLVTGKDCPHTHMRDTRSKKSTTEYAFCLIPLSDQDEALHFVAPTEKILCYWTDAINVLLKREMVSKEAKQDIETLQSMYVSIQLLDTEGVDLPSQPPAIPPLPPNFDFALKY